MPSPPYKCQAEAFYQYFLPIIIFKLLKEKVTKLNYIIYSGQARPAFQLSMTKSKPGPFIKQANDLDLGLPKYKTLCQDPAQNWLARPLNTSTHMYEFLL